MSKQAKSLFELTSDEMNTYLAETGGSVVADHLAAGLPVYYTDPSYPGKIIKELPNGARCLVHRDEHQVEHVDGWI